MPPPPELTREQLLPCPFCNAAARLMNPSGAMDGSWPWVECLACAACSPCRKEDADAIAAWNTRAPSPAAAGAVVVPEKILKLAGEWVAEPDTRARVKVQLALAGMPAMADAVDEGVAMARFILSLKGRGDG